MDVLPSARGPPVLVSLCLLDESEGAFFNGEERTGWKGREEESGGSGYVYNIVHPLFFLRLLCSQR